MLVLPFCLKLETAYAGLKIDVEAELAYFNSIRDELLRE